MNYHNELRIANSVHYTTLAAWKIALVYISSVHASSWLQAVPFPTCRLGFDMAPNEMQWSIKWWLGLPLTPEGEVCAYCRPDKELDAHHAVTCKFGGDVVARHNTLSNVSFEFCKRALLNPKLEAGAGLGHETRLTRPADILIPSWSTSDKPAVIDVSITSPLKSFCLKREWLQVQQLDRQRRESNDPICSELGWKCVPLVVETFGAWGRTAVRPFFCTTSSTTCGTRKFHKGYHAEFHLWQIESLISSSQRPCFPRKVTQRQNNGPA